jgi:hypothetical protein
VSFRETYEFFALDRCLTPAEMRALRRISTRATITPARFYNFYDWGELKGDPREMLRRYFDLFVYTGNGRPYVGMLRFPVARIDRRRWRPYVTEQRGMSPPARSASIVTVGDVAILTIEPAEDTRLRSVTTARQRFVDADEGWENEGVECEFKDEVEDGFEDEASWPVPLALARAALLGGDLRPLYLLWLLSVQCGERSEGAMEPPRPPELGRLTGSLRMFVEFLRLNADLLTVAVEAPTAATRTAGQMLDAARAWTDQRRHAAARRAATARAKRLAVLERRQDSEWTEIDRLLGAPKVKPSIYDDVVRRLTALQELGVDRGEETAFQARLRSLLARHASKTALHRRVRAAGLIQNIGYSS